MFSQPTSSLPSVIIKSTYSDYRVNLLFGLNSLQFLLADFRLICYGRVEWLAVYIFIPLDKQSQTDHPVKTCFTVESSGMKLEVQRIGEY